MLSRYCIQTDFDILILLLSLMKLTLFGWGGGEGQNGHLRAFAEYLKNGSADFQQTYVTF